MPPRGWAEVVTMLNKCDNGKSRGSLSMISPTARWTVAVFSVAPIVLNARQMRIGSLTNPRYALAPPLSQAVRDMLSSQHAPTPDPSAIQGLYVRPVAARHPVS